MHDSAKTSNRQTGPRCVSTPTQLSLEESVDQRHYRQCGPSGDSRLTQIWINHSRLIGPCAQLEPCATIWTGPQTLGRTKNLSLSPSRKSLTQIYLLPLSSWMK